MPFPFERLKAVVAYLRGRYPAFERFLPKFPSTYQDYRQALRSLLSFYEGEGLPDWVEKDLSGLLVEESLARGVIEPLALPLSSLPKTAYWEGNILRARCDAIVFSLSSPLEGSLVPGDTSLEAQVQEAVGPLYKQSLRKLREERKGRYGEVGEAFLLPSSCIPASHLIGVVVPHVEVRPTENDEKGLRDAYWNALALARKNRFKTVVIASLATGGNRYPYKEAARVAVDAGEVNHARYDESPVVVFALPSQRQYDCYEELLG